MPRNHIPIGACPLRPVIQDAEKSVSTQDYKDIYARYLPFLWNEMISRFGYIYL